MHADRILTNATLFTSEGKTQSQQAIAISGEKILWTGPDDALPQIYRGSKTIIEDCQNALVTPGLIDCHTHIVYAGNRADEFPLKLSGANYAELAQKGFGILSTVRKTRAASESELIEAAIPRVRALQKEGVTTLEIKSGYGLNLETEIKMLRVARELGVLLNMRVRTTFLGAHAIPLEFGAKSQDYVDYLCQEMLPEISAQKLADAVDVYCESFAFSLAQTEQIFQAAQQVNLPIKCHADQFSNLGASSLAAKMQALSCDHLEFLKPEDAAMMAKMGTVAVLLPGSFYFLGETQIPPIDLLRQHGIKIAIATDANPGTSPTASLQLMMSMACRFFRLTIPEAIAAVTTNAAYALGLEQEIGSLKKGMFADLLCWSFSDPAALCYHFGYPLPHKKMIKGKWLSQEQTCPL